MSNIRDFYLREIATLPPIERLWLAAVIWRDAEAEFIAHENAPNDEPGAWSDEDMRAGSQLWRERFLQTSALAEIQDETMSCLHAQPLRHDSIDSAHVKRWLQRLYDISRKGLGKPEHFASLEVQARMNQSDE